MRPGDGEVVILHHLQQDVDPGDEPPVGDRLDGVSGKQYDLP